MDSRHAAAITRASANTTTPDRADQNPRVPDHTAQARPGPAGDGAPRVRAVNRAALAREAAQRHGAADPSVRSAITRPGEDLKRSDAGVDRDVAAERRTPPQAGGAASAQAEAIVRRVVEALGHERVSRWFGAPARVSLEDGRVRVRVVDRATGALLEKRFGDVVRAAATAELGTPTGLEVIVEAGIAGAPEQRSTLAPSPNHKHPPHAPHAPQVTPAPPARTPANDRHRLETFVVGESNRLAYNAAIQLAETAGDAKGISPLFLHGPCGVGKTHLMNGVAARFKERHPGAVVRVTTGEQFMNDFVGAIRAAGSPGSGAPANGAGGVERFRRAYRKVDLLCIDDVHFLASKQATQAELLNAFDEIARGGARIVLVSDEHPRRLRTFSAALVSRFMSGMVAGLATPDAELRGRIIRALASARGLTLDDAAAGTLIERTGPVPGAPTPSVRDIEGMITKIDAVHRLMPAHAGTRIGAVTVQRALDGEADAPAHTSDVAQRPVRIEQIIAHACTALAVDTADLSGKTRHKRVVMARAVITHLARQLTTLSYPDIARALGRPNHSTVITAHQRFQRQLAADEPVDAPHAPEARTVTVLTRQLARSVQNAKRA